MSMLAIAPASSSADQEAALQLAALAFVPAGSNDELLPWKRFLWFEDPSFERANLIVGRDVDGRLAGMIRIVPRVLRRGEQRLTVAGISSVCVAPAQRGKGHSTALMRWTVDHCRERGFDIAALIARRSADHFYTRFGFWGVSAYSQLSIAPVTQVPGLLTPAPAREEWIGCYREAFDHCYAECFGRFERDERLWRHQLRRLMQIDRLRFVSLLRADVPVGYAIVFDRTIVEIALTEVPPGAALVAALRVLVPGDVPLTVDMPPQHRLLGALQGLDVSFRHRECSFGGHMVRVLNPHRLAALLAARVGVRLARLRSSGFSASVEGIGLAWDGAHCSATVEEQATPPEFRQSCALLGARMASEPAADPLGDERLPFNLCYQDQP